MELTVKHFRELTTEELYDIYRLRAAVFVVEQNCVYQDVDDADKTAYHLWLSDEDGIQAYLRVLQKGARFEDVSIGRVIAVKRRRGLGSRILAAGIQAAKEKFQAKRIVLEAQVYARKLYENAGFVQTSGEFLEDGIPHIQMTLELETCA